MRCEGYESAAEAHQIPRRRREICRSFAYISPWSIFPRWSSGGKFRFSNSKFMERNWGKSKIDGDLGLQRELATVPSSFAEDFPETGKGASLSIGVRYGPIYLLKYELNKMVKLRRRNESLLSKQKSKVEAKNAFTLRDPITRLRYLAINLEGLWSCISFRRDPLTQFPLSSCSWKGTAQGKKLLQA